MTDIKSLNYDELVTYMAGLGEKKFRASQLYQWMHEKLADSFDECTNLSNALRQNLKETSEYVCLEPVRVQHSKLDGTEKYLFRLSDGNYVESVLMKYHHGNSVCISSQVGCRMGCRFCASTLNGKVRDLRPSEMLDQIYRIQKITGERVSNVVVMGSGEPMDNYDNLIKFIELLNDERGLNISQRNITVSSCGIVPKLKELADLKLQITLAISLHAPNDELRKTMMPIANKYSIEEIMDVCRYYIECTGRRISFEYSLVKGVNDSMECAKQLIELVKGMNCHINLIPVNPIKGEVLDGFSYYQLQGTDKQGHHVASLLVIDYAKSGLDQTIGIDKTISEKGSEADKAKLKNSISKHVSVYSKENAQQQLASLPGDTVEGAKLAKAVKAINDNIPSHINNTFDKLLAADKKTSAKDKEAISTFAGFMAKQLSVDATHVAYKPVQTRYGTAVTGDVRGAVGFDGFRNSFALIGYAIPTDKGLSVQFLYSDDSSYDYWNNELNHMYQTQSLKGGK